MSAFYLKYRPQKLSDLIGQEQIKKALQNAFESGKLSHAYLFVGPRGTGKTSTARILAKMVNCSAEQNEVPCNVCSSCLSITDGSNLDLIEIDAASNRGIEDIRSLRDGIKLSPAQSKKKIYIIDEVHMLTTEAFNALLKTLEEPPFHALFILATTDASKIPQTIMSRVQRLDFKPANHQDLSEALSKIIKAEKLDVDEEAQKLIAKMSEGSFRDAVKLLDQITSSGGKITAKEIEESLRSSQFEDLTKLLENFPENKSKEALEQVVFLKDKGLDFKQVLISLMNMLRNLIFIKNGLGQTMVEGHLTEEKYEKLIKLSQFFEDKKLIGILNILQNSFEQLKFTPIPSLPLELAVLEICSLDNLNKSDNKDLNVLDKSETGKNPAPDDSDSLIYKAPNAPVASNLVDSADVLKLKEKWTYVCETIRPYNFSLEALLRSVKLSSCSEKVLTIEVPYTFHQRILEAPKNRDILESIFSEILGRNIRISAVLGVRPQRKDDVANIEAAADDEIIRIASEIFNSDSVN